MDTFLWICILPKAFALSDSIEDLSFTELLSVGFSVTGLVLFSGVTYSLSTRILHLNPTSLELKARNSFSRQQVQIQKVLGVLSRYHRVYVTLLVANVLALETLPIVLNEVLSPLWTTGLTITLVIIVLSSITGCWFSGRKRLSRVSEFVPFLNFLIVVFSPVAYPLSILLDRLIPTHSPVLLTKAQLKKALFLRSEVFPSPPDSDSLSSSQLSMLQTLLDRGKEPVMLHMCPLDKVFSLSTDTLVCEELLEEVAQRRFSRIPIRDSSDPGLILGTVHISLMLNLDCNKLTTLSKSGIEISPPFCVARNALLVTVMMQMLTSQEQLAVVVDKVWFRQSEEEETTLAQLSKGQALGIITQTDLMRLLLNLRKTQEPRVSRYTGSGTVFRELQLR